MGAAGSQSVPVNRILFWRAACGGHRYEEPVAAASATSKRKGGGGGLEDLLGDLGGKKTKLNVLEKSKLDWGQFVRKEGLTDELRVQRQDGYLERRAFLDRAAERAYEAERANRLKGSATDANGGLADEDAAPAAPGKGNP